MAHEAGGTPQTLRDGRYTLVDMLGEGGMAVVWRAFDHRLQAWRAIKILLHEYAQKPKLVARFRVEARTMAALDHPNIVRVYDVEDEQIPPFIVMELVEGGNLIDWMERHGVMHPRLAIDVMVDTAKALDHAHNQGIVHRDVKPHNVMIDRSGTIRLTDFGIARAADDDNNLTRTGAVMGTWGFMAPEQRTDAKSVDRRADVYSLGATLFSLITGRTPFDLFLSDRDPSILEGVPGPLIAVLMRATAYKPHDRYPDCLALAAALQEVRPQFEDGAVVPDLLLREVLARPGGRDEPGATILPGAEAAGDDVAIGDEFEAPRVGPRVVADADETSVRSDAPTSIRTGPLPVPGNLPTRPAPERTPNRPVLTTSLGYDSSTEVQTGVPGRLNLLPLSLGLVAVSFVALVWVLNQPTQVIVQAPTPVIAPQPPTPVVAAQATATPTPPPEPSAPQGALPSSPKPAAAPVRAPAAPPASPAAAPTPAPVAAPEPPRVAQCLKEATLVGAPSVGKEATFRVSACQPGTVTLHYRAANGSWLRKGMAARNGVYAAKVMLDHTFKDGLEWYVSTDDAQAGSSARPFKAEVL